MTTLHIALPEDVLKASSMDEQALTDLAREALLVRLYERGALSSGKAARLLSISRREFLDRLGQYGVSSFDEDIDLAAEMQRGLV